MLVRRDGSPTQEVKEAPFLLPGAAGRHNEPIGVHVVLWVITVGGAGCTTSLHTVWSATRKTEVGLWTCSDEQAVWSQTPDTLRSLILGLRSQRTCMKTFASEPIKYRCSESESDMSVSFSLSDAFITSHHAV